MQSHPGSLQARLGPNSDTRLYNANRDLAHNFKQLATEVADRLEDQRWAELQAYLDSRQVTQDDLGEACAAFCQFIAGQAMEKPPPGVKPVELMRQELEESGWLDTKPEAQIAVMATLGSVVLGVHWAGVREATLGGEGPALSLRELASYGQETAIAMTLPRWRRRWRKRLFRLKQAWRALRKSDSK